MIGAKGSTVNDTFASIRMVKSSRRGLGMPDSKAHSPAHPRKHRQDLHRQDLKVDGQIFGLSADRLWIAVPTAMQSNEERGRKYLPPLTMDVDHGHVVRRRLLKIAIVMRLHQVTPGYTRLPQSTGGPRVGET